MAKPAKTKEEKEAEEKCKCMLCEACGYSYPKRFLKIMNGKLLCPYHRDPSRSSVG